MYINMDKIVIKKSLYAAAGPAGLFATAVGFFSDFVKPYLNLVPYFFILCALCAAGLWMFVVRKQARHGNLDEILQTRSGMVFAISVLASVFWLIMLPIFALTPERGLAASAVPSIGDWQERLFGKLDRIESKIDTVLSKIEQIDSGSAGLIASPKTSNDHYHNARIHELNGNLVEAKKSYEAYFKAGLSYVDPFFSYALILKNLEGPSSARVLMGELRDSYPDNPAASLAYIMAKEVVLIESHYSRLLPNRVQNLLRPISISQNNTRSAKPVFKRMMIDAKSVRHYKRSRRVKKQKASPSTTSIKKPLRKD